MKKATSLVLAILVAFVAMGCEEEIDWQAEFEEDHPDMRFPCSEEPDPEMGEGTISIRTSEQDIYFWILTCNGNEMGAHYNSSTHIAGHYFYEFPLPAGEYTIVHPEDGEFRRESVKLTDGAEVSFDAKDWW